MISKKVNNFLLQTCKLSKLQVLLGVYTYIVRNLVRRNVKETDIPACNSQLAKLPILVKGDEGSHILKFSDRSEDFGIAK